jgi:uncharacterized protein YneF (UPF0154 family)
MNWLTIILVVFILVDLLVVGYIVATKRRRAPKP